MGKGAILEGLTSEVMSLIQQDTSGKIEIIKDKTTYQQDSGVDVVASVQGSFSFINYWDNLVNESKSIIKDDTSSEDNNDDKD